LLVVNKPAGITVLPDGYHPEKLFLKQELESGFGRMWVVHRLDRQTSGVIVFARNPDTHRLLNTHFQNRNVRKIYHALVIGTPSWKVRVVDLPLLVDGDRKHRTVVDIQHGKPSKTELLKMEVFKDYSLVKVVPHTGRTHQIRVHLAAEGLPVACDQLYGDGNPVYLSKIKPNYQKGDIPEQALLDRVGLHAVSLKIPAVGMQGTMEFTAPYQDDFMKTLLQLRKNPPG
jgi:RluA family pseudouridine synthase